jgi:hypothetical protein
MQQIKASLPDEVNSLREQAASEISALDIKERVTKPNTLHMLKESPVSPPLTTDIIDRIPFNVLRDKHNVLAKKMGLVLRLPPLHQQRLSTSGLNIGTLTKEVSFTFLDTTAYTLSLLVKFPRLSCLTIIARVPKLITFSILFLHNNYSFSKDNYS